MFILSQNRTDLYNLDHFSDIRVVLGDSYTRIMLDSTTLGTFKDNAVVEGIYVDILNWISDPVRNGIRQNIFYIPEDN